MLTLLPILTLLQNQIRMIDPLLLVQGEQIMSTIGQKDNPVWPGWDARKTPILIYLPGKQDVLINHPSPPKGFAEYRGPVRTRLGKIWIKDGPTIFEFDGQNTSTSINGVRTLVVADTLSSRRQWIQGLTGSTGDLMDNGLYPNPFSGMTLFAHEAFHVFQEKAASSRGVDEMMLSRYPSLSVVNNVGYALESDFLEAALKASSPEQVRAAGIKWLAVRQNRRNALTPDAVSYENATEFSEGLAKYVEYRLLQSLEGKEPTKEMWLLQGFKGFKDLTKERQLYIRQMSGFMSGTNNVNNDLYGASPVRYRLYFSGMGVGALLDKLRFEWKTKILSKGSTLTALAEEALKATPLEIAAAMGEIQTSERIKSLRNEKENLAANGGIYIENVLKEFESAPGEVVIDYSKLNDAKIGFSYTSFGILRVDDDRTIFRLLPIRGQVETLKFAEDGARPILYDRKRKQIRLLLTALPPAIGEHPGSTINLPGVTLSDVKGTARVEGRLITIELEQSNTFDISLASKMFLWVSWPAATPIKNDIHTFLNFIDRPLAFKALGLE